MSSANGMDGMVDVTNTLSREGFLPNEKCLVPEGEG